MDLLLQESMGGHLNQYLEPKAVMQNDTSLGKDFLFTDFRAVVHYYLLSVMHKLFIH